MSDKEPTNGMIHTELRGFRELVEKEFQHSHEWHNKTDEHLEKLNGQVGDNTDYRKKVNNYWKLVAFVVTTPSVMAIAAAAYAITK